MVVSPACSSESSRKAWMQERSTLSRMVIIRRAPMWVLSRRTPNICGSPDRDVSVALSTDQPVRDGLSALLVISRWLPGQNLRMVLGLGGQQAARHVRAGAE